jgi:hypothetical protein
MNNRTRRPKHSGKPIAIRIDRDQYERLKLDAKDHNRSAVAQLKSILYFHYFGKAE